MIFGIKCFGWTLDQGICRLLKEEEIEGPKAIPDFGGGNLQRTMLCIVEQKRHLARRKVVDTLVAQKVIIEALTNPVQRGHGHKDVFYIWE